MLIDFVLGYTIHQKEDKDKMLLLRDYLVQKGHTVRIFQGYASQRQEWMNKLQNIYFYANKAFLDEEDYISYGMGYKKQIAKLGPPDIVLGMQYPLMIAICRLALSSLGQKAPPLVFWLWSEKINLEESKVFYMADACIIRTRKMKEDVEHAGSEGSCIYGILEDLEEEKALRAFEYILLKCYYEQQCKAYKIESK